MNVLLGGALMNNFLIEIIIGMSFAEFSEISGQISGVVGVFILLGGILMSIWRFIYNPIKKMVKAHTDGISSILAEVLPADKISLRKSVEEIKLSLDRLESIQKTRLQYETVPYFEASPKMFLNWCNRSMLKMYGRGDAEILGNGWRNFIIPAHRDRVNDYLEETISFGNDLKIYFKIEAANDTIRCVSCEALGVKGPDGSVISYVGVLVPKDIEECE